MLLLSSLSCTSLTSFFVPPTPTATPTATPTLTPTATPTETPSPTPEPLLSREERGEYYLILRYISDAVQQRFLPIQDFLSQQGYTVDIDEGPSMVGDMDVILYGAPSCLDAIDDLILLLHDKLALQDLEPTRFTSDDLGYNEKTIVIQIRDIDRFDPGL
jgi:hypothetical protein